MRKYTKKFLSAALALSLLISLAAPANTISAAPTGTASLSTQREEIERKLKAAEQKLEELGEESRETEEYIAVLDEKIRYLNEQYALAKKEISAVEEKVTRLEGSITQNEKEIESIQAEVRGLEKSITSLNKNFESTYKAYCGRMRALYISGAQGSILTFLLSGEGITNMLTRFEMVRAVSKQDGALLESVKNQTTKIVNTRDKLEEKKQTLSTNQKKLKIDKEDLKSEKSALLEKQESMQKQQAVIEEQQTKANTLLKELNEKTKKYGEYRDITQEELDAIDADIEAADKKYPVTTTTTTTTATTTKKPTTTTTTTTTTRKTSGQSSTSTTKQTTATTTKKQTTTTKAATTSSSKYISLTYPCPRYTTITCGFGAYAGHTGCDFSTRGNENQKIVAAESGTVILVKLLNTSYGHYLVIRHDKTTSSGKMVYTLYAHNNDIIVSDGQHVDKGQQIAYSGTTGNSTGPHCHFEVRVGGSTQGYAVNPANYLP